jgi:hypothetical protein
MDLRPRVQVVLGEAERTDGLLRFVLEGEGFDIVGLASDDQELARVLRGARPTVIVLDGGISAAAALDARRSSPGASLVVVWPDGVSAVLAEERVDPHLVIPDLGEAVRKAAHRAEPIEPLIRVPESLHIATTPRRPIPPPVRSEPAKPKPARVARRGSRLLVAAATWMLVLTALGTIAIAVPKAFDLFPSERAPRSSLSPSVGRRPAEVTTAPEQTDATGQQETCEASSARAIRMDRARGRSTSDPVRARSCPPDHTSGKGGNVKGEKAKGEKVNQGGRPEDPGSQANGGSSDQAPRNGREGEVGSVVDDGSATGGVSGGKSKGNGAAANGGGGEHANSG